MQKVDLKDTFTKSDLNFLHDTIYEALGYSPSDDEVIEHFKSLPESLKNMGYFWGCEDTVFRDKMYEFLSKEN